MDGMLVRRARRIEGWPLTPGGQEILARAPVRVEALDLREVAGGGDLHELRAGDRLSRLASQLRIVAELGLHLGRRPGLADGRAVALADDQQRRDLQVA